MSDVIAQKYIAVITDDEKWTWEDKVPSFIPGSSIPVFNFGDELQIRLDGETSEHTIEFIVPSELTPEQQATLHYPFVGGRRSVKFEPHEPLPFRGRLLGEDKFIWKFNLSTARKKIDPEFQVGPGSARPGGLDDDQASKPAERK